MTKASSQHIGLKRSFAPNEHAKKAGFLSPKVRFKPLLNEALAAGLLVMEFQGVNKLGGFSINAWTSVN